MRSFVYGVMTFALITVAPGVATAKRCANDAAVAATRAAAAARCDCAAAENHGQYVSCVAGVAKEFAGTGVLPEECKGEVVRCAAKSTCGKPEAVTCCRVDRRGKVKCSTKKSADKCQPPNGGTACIGSATSCCEACGSAGGGGPPPTTTKAPPPTQQPPTTTPTPPQPPTP